MIGFGKKKKPLFLETPPAGELSPRYQDVSEFYQEIEKALENGQTVILYSKESHLDFIEQYQLMSKESFSEIPLVGFFSSGTTGDFKLIFHSYQSLIQSAKESGAILKNSHSMHFKKTPKKIISSLPFFHVGGFLNFLRAREYDWEFHSLKKMKRKPGLFDSDSLIIGVPAQLQNLLLEKSNHFTFYAGGDAVSPTLKKQAKLNNINLISTYGLTESAGAIIYQEDESEIKCFSDVEIKITANNRLSFKTKRLCVSIWSLYQSPHLKPAPLIQGFFETSDLAKILPNGEVRILGRADNIILSGGENISPEKVKNDVLNVLKKLSILNIKIMGMPDSRLGKVVVIFIQLQENSLTEAAELVRSQLKGVDRPRFLYPFPKHLGLKPSYKDFLNLFNKKDMGIKL